MWGPFLEGDSHAGAACLWDRHFEQTHDSEPVYGVGWACPLASVHESFTGPFQRLTLGVNRPHCPGDWELAAHAG